MGDDAWLAEARKAITAGLALKKIMISKGLAKARAKCPTCGNETLQGRLAGRKNHLRMWCDTPGCDIQMME